MPRTYTDKLEYRRRTNGGTWSAWTLLSADATSPFSISPALTTGYEYELRITRSKSGSVTKVGDVSTGGSIYSFADGVTVSSSGGTLSQPGTYSVTLGGQKITVTRSATNPSVTVGLGGGNWTYVAVAYAVAGVWSYHSVNNKNWAPYQINGNTYTVNTNVIAETGNNTGIVEIKLPATQPMEIYLEYANNSSGTISVLTI